MDEIDAEVGSKYVVGHDQKALGPVNETQEWAENSPKHDGKK